MTISSTYTLANNIKMPCLGLGVYKSDSGNETEQAVRHALDLGYRLIDTAAYYENEASVGKAIRKSGVSRDMVFVTTKLWNDDQGFESTLKAFDESINKMELDYIDLYMIHWPVPKKFMDSYKALEKLYQEGRVKAIGVSNFTSNHLQTLIDSFEIKPMVNQCEFHPRLVQTELLEFCKTNDIVFQSWAPLMRGQILDNDIIKTIGNVHNKSTAQIVLRWHLQKGIAIIPKSVHVNRIKENSELFDFKLNDEQMAKISELHNNTRTGAHPDNFMDHF